MTARYTPGAPQEFLDGIGHLAEMGVTWTAGHSGGHGSFSAALDGLRQFGEEVIREVPLNAQSVYTDNAGVRIHALDNGVDDTSVPPVVVVPGMGESAEEYAWLLTELGNRRVVIVDVRGRGQSDAPAAGLPVGRPLRRSRGHGGGACVDRPVFVAFSRGSSYAMGYALAHPHEVRGLVIGDYWARHVGLPPEFGERQLAVVLRGVPMSERMPAHAVHGVARESREVPLWDRVREFEFPVLVIRGGRKSALVTDELAAQWEAALPGVELVMLPESRARPLEPRPGRVSRGAPPVPRPDHVRR